MTPGRGSFASYHFPVMIGSTYDNSTSCVVRTARLQPLADIRDTARSLHSDILTGAPGVSHAVTIKHCEHLIHNGPINDHIIHLGVRTGNTYRHTSLLSCTIYT